MSLLPDTVQVRSSLPLMPLSPFDPGEHSVNVKEKEAGGEEREGEADGGCMSVGSKSVGIGVEGRGDGETTLSGAGVKATGGGRGLPCSGTGHDPPLSPCAI